MKTIEQLYEPYNFSKTKCYVFTLTITKGNYTRIEHKVPWYIKKLEGIYVSVSLLDTTKTLAGIISLNFNGQSLKCFHLPIHRTQNLNDFSHPLPLNEDIKRNSFIQGYFISKDLTVEEFPYTLSIYLHYTK